MTADPAEPYEIIRLGGVAAAIIPLDELADLHERMAATIAAEEARA